MKTVIKRIIKKIPIISFTFMAMSCSSTQKSSVVLDPNTAEGALPHVENCSKTISLKHNNLHTNTVKNTCDALLNAQTKFHQLFNTQNSPVQGDQSTTMQVVVYGSQRHYVVLANEHFSIPTGNAGVFIEGKPSQSGNVVKFVTYNDTNKINNVVHEFTRYLDGRFNLAGNYCESLHDDHSAPNFCENETPIYPHLVWWTEGLGQYISFGNNYIDALAIAHEKTYQLSDIFNTSYNRNSGNERTYQYSYLAVRYMLEHHKSRIDRVLNLLRAGEYKAYQKMVRSWGRSMDQDFSKWLMTVKKS